MIYDVIIIGSGPAGTSTAFPLIASGKKVLMLDWGNDTALSSPAVPHYISRLNDKMQWEWMLGKTYFSLKNAGAVSPKFRIPTLSHVFKDFSEQLNTQTENFFVAGSMALGGLSTAWGAGVAALDSRNLIYHFGHHYREMYTSYATVAHRMGISGRCSDDMKYYFGLDSWSSDPIEIDPLASYINNNYRVKNAGSSRFKLGRSRIAVLNEQRGDRQKCDKSGNCLWGCAKKAIYSAKYDLDALLRSPNFTLIKDRRVTDVESLPEGSEIHAVGRDGVSYSYRTSAVFLAAGTLSSTKVLVRSLKIKNKEIEVQSCPAAAFLLFIPRFFGRKVESSEFGLGQLSFNVKTKKKDSAFGSILGTQGLPLFEFSRYVPMGQANALKLLSRLMNACVIGNVFLPGCFSKSKIIVDEKGNMKIEGKYDERYQAAGKEVKGLLRSNFLKLGAILFPFSFKFTQPGACIHYASTFPMKEKPVLGQCKLSGEVIGLENVYLVDGSSLPNLTEKSHTLTIMANADRIAREYLKIV